MHVHVQIQVMAHIWNETRDVASLVLLTCIERFQLVDKTDGVIIICLKTITLLEELYSWLSERTGLSNCSALAWPFEY